MNTPAGNSTTSTKSNFPFQQPRKVIKTATKTSQAQPRVLTTGSSNNGAYRSDKLCEQLKNELSDLKNVLSTECD